MALILLGDRNLNNMERNSASVVKTFEYDSTKYASGDFVYLGSLPRDAILLRCFIVVDGNWSATSLQATVGEGTLINNNTDIAFSAWESFRPAIPGVHHVQFPQGDNIFENVPYNGKDTVARVNTAGVALRLDDIDPDQAEAMMQVVIEYAYIGNKQTGGYLS